MSRADTPDKYAEQIEQEDEYEIPYHFASRFEPSFQTGFIDAWAMNYNLSIELVLKLLRKEQPGSVLDIGCGDGRLSQEIHKAFSDATVAGADYSSRAIQLAEAMVPDVQFHHLDITAEHSLGKFDSAVLMEVFEHIPPEQTRQFASAVAGLVKANGLLIVTVPHVNKPLEYKHFQHFTASSLDEYFMPYFDVEKTIFLEQLGWLNRLLNSCVANGFFVLNRRRLLEFIYRRYQDWVFQCDNESQCARIAVCYRRRSDEST
jgi:2-polyprenyl-3-methyl-5-hydroxy-6-metoxy-1,4-benzoquinol methylase